MRKIIMAVAIVTMAGSAQAQKISWGARVGLNIPWVSEKSDRADFKQYLDKSNIGFHVGAILDWGLTESFYIQPGLYFTTKGAKGKDDTSSGTLNLSYLQIPILASYRFKLGGDTKLHINAGPYFAYGIGGKYKSEETYRGTTTTHENNSFGDGDEDLKLKRFDAGLAFGVGVGFLKNYYAGLNYDLGLANFASEKSASHDNYKLKNQSFNISIGYNFL